MCDPATIDVFFFSPSPIVADANGTARGTVTWATSNAGTGTFECPSIPIPSRPLEGRPGEPNSRSGHVDFAVAGVTAPRDVSCTITANNGVGEITTRTVSVTLNPPPPTCTLGFSPSSVIADPTIPNQTLLSWTTTNATSGAFTCTGPLPRTNVPISPVAGGSVWVGFSGVSSPQTERCTLTVMGPGGTCPSCCEATVEVNPLPLPPTIDSLHFSPAPVWADSSGAVSGKVFWTTTNATSGRFSCTSIPERALIPLSGSASFAFANVTAPRPESCTVTATNSVRSVSLDKSVDLKPYKPTSVTLAISPNPVAPGRDVTARWSGNNTPTNYTLIQMVPFVESAQGLATELTVPAPSAVGRYRYKVRACNGHPAGCGESREVVLRVTLRDPVPGDVWRIKDEGGRVILTIDSDGNAFAPGGLPVYVGGPMEAPPRSTRFRGGGADNFVFHSTGIWIRGQALEGQSQAVVDARGPSDLLIKGAAGRNVARFAANGDVYLLGSAGFVP